MDILEMALSKFRYMKVILYLALALVFYNEFAVYWVNYMSWPQLHKTSVYKSKNNTQQKSTRFLLVADPQLIGIKTVA